MDIALPPAGDHRPDAEVLAALNPSCRLLLHDRAEFDDRFLTVLAGMLPDQHPLQQVPAAALDVLDVVLRAVLSGQSAEQTEAECQDCGERGAVAGLPDDAYAVVGRAVARAAREAAGESWSSAMSSGWAAVHRWVVGHLAAGACRARTRGEVWHSFPELAPSAGAAGAAGPITGSVPVPSDGARPTPDEEWALLEQAAVAGTTTAPATAPTPSAPSGRRAPRGRRRADGG